MKIALAFAACYLMGAVPVGMIVGKLKGVDIRKFGSGNIGATNVLRTLGKGPASIVMIGDTLKGFLAVFLCKDILHFDPWLVVLGGFLGVFGHSFSLFLGFKGGKGVATSLGMIIGFNWLIASITFGIWVFLSLVTRYISIASCIAAASVPVMMFSGLSMFGPEVAYPYKVVSLIAALLIVVKHRSNFARLLKGTEPKLGQKVDIEGDRNG